MVLGTEWTNTPRCVLSLTRPVRPTAPQQPPSLHPASHRLSLDRLSLGRLRARPWLAGEHPTGDIDERAGYGYGAGLLGGQKRRRGGDLLQPGRATRHPHPVRAFDQAPQGGLVLEAAVDRGELLPSSLESVSGRPTVQMPSTQRPRGPTSAARVHTKASVAASAGPVRPISRASFARSGTQREDDAGSLSDDHVARRRPRGGEVGAESVGHGSQEIVGRQLDQR